MANTTMVAKNTFADGLVMDFSPDNTQSTSLTSALNATLITFNGNEMALQNDMGNGRVETAYLPEGYVPIGTCEFGDIIYIVSYNPLTNKSEIGCFPSPERNISSEETGMEKQILSTNDFQEVQGDQITGKLKASSVKKILYSNQLNPGDKFIIYDKSGNILENKDTFTDIGNTSHVYGAYPKLLRVHVVAIEDSGKINYLDSTVKWYDKQLNQADSDYFIQQTTSDSTGPDIDSYRSLVQSAYSIFQGKVSGQLALLVELEKIRSFSCTYEVYKVDQSTEDDMLYNNYKIFWNITWDSDDININPSYIVLTKSEWSGKKENKGGKYYKYYKVDGNNYKIDYDDPSKESSVDNVLPVAYDSSNYNQEYWYSPISLSYNYELPFNDENQNYASAESKYISEHSNSIGTKISVDRKNGMPNGTSKNEQYSYYINAHHAQVENGELVYYRSTGSSFVKIEKEVINDDIVNNYYKTGVYKDFSTFKIPFKQIINGNQYDIDISNLIYNYEISPAMPYGILEELAQNGYIDFSKIGSGIIDLTKWSYYNSENVSQLSLGLDVYPESNKNVEEVVLEFYDNQGIAAAYRISNKQSYSGLFTEYIPLNGQSSNYKLTKIDAYNNTIYHAGQKADLTLSPQNLIYFDNGIPYQAASEDVDGEIKYYYYKLQDGSTNKILVDDTEKLYEDDSGTIYSNFLYLVKIVVKYTSVNALGDLDSSNTSDYRIFYRWYWTNTIFNEYYYSVTDFDILKPELTLDVSATYSPQSNYGIKSFNYPSNSQSVVKGNNFPVQNLSSIVQTISGDINISLDIGLLQTYNTFNLENVAVDNTSITTYLGDRYVESGDTEIKYSQDNFVNNVDIIKPIDSSDPYDTTNYGPELIKLLTNEDSDSDKEEINTDSYTNYKNQFELVFKEEQGNEELQYIGYKQTEISKNCPYFKINTLDQEVELNVSLINFSKFGSTYTNQNSMVPILRSVIDQNNLEQYQLMYNNNHFYLKRCHFLLLDGHCHTNRGDHHSWTNAMIKSYEYNGSSLSSQVGTGDLWVTQEEGKWYNYSQFPGIRSGGIIKDSQFVRDSSQATTVYSNNHGFILYSRFTSDHGGNWDDSYALFTGANISVAEYNNESTIYFPTGLQGISMSHLSYFDSPRGDGGFGAHSADSSSGSPVVWLAFNDTESSQIHYFNDVFQTNSPSLGIENLKQEIKYKNNYSQKLPSTIGDALMSVMTKMYKYEGTIETTIQKLYNFIYLNNYSTIYTKDIIYKVEITDNKENLCIQGIKYNDYVTTVQNKCYNYQSNNVNIVIKSCIKNIPLQFKVDYTYEYPDNELTNKAQLNTFGQEPIYVPYSIQFDQNQIYQYVDNEISLLGSNFNFKWIKNTIFDDQEIKYTTEFFEDSTTSNPNLYKIFSLQNGKLVLKTTSPPRSDQMFSYWSRGDKVDNKSEEYVSISDLVKYENIVPFAKLV